MPTGFDILEFGGGGRFIIGVERDECLVEPVRVDAEPVKRFGFLVGWWSGNEEDGECSTGVDDNDGFVGNDGFVDNDRFFDNEARGYLVILGSGPKDDPSTRALA